MELIEALSRLVTTYQEYRTWLDSEVDLGRPYSDNNPERTARQHDLIDLVGELVDSLPEGTV